MTSLSRLRIRAAKWAGSGPTSRWRLAVLFAAATLVIGIVKYGVGTFPGLQNMLALTQSWLAPGDAGLNEDYLLSSPISFVFPGALSLNATAPYLLYAGVAACIALALPYFLGPVSTHQERQRMLFLLIVGGPVLPLLLQWIGGYDTITVIALAVAILARHPWIQWVAWLVVGTNHAFVGLLAIALLTSTWFLARSSLIQKKDPRTVIVSWLGLICGGVLSWFLAEAWGMKTSRIDMYLGYGWHTYLELFLWQAPLIAFSVLGIGWLVLLDGRLRDLLVTRITLIQGLIVMLVVPLIALDQSRIAALVMLGPMLYWALQVSQHRPFMALAVWKRYKLVAIIVPVILVFTDQAYYFGWRLFTWVPPVAPILDAIR